MAVREKLAACYVRPIWNWPCHLVEPVPQKLIPQLYRAVLRTRCDWWCQGRWWCQRPQLHPHFSAVFQMLKACDSKRLRWSPFLDAAASALFATIGLKYVAFERPWGFRVSIAPRDDKRIYQATAAVRGLSPNEFWTGSKQAAHAVRIIARVRCLQSVHQSRQDAEGVDSVDVEASSNKI